MADNVFYIETPRLFISHFDASQDSHCDFLVQLYDTKENRAHKPASAQMLDREGARRGIMSNDPNTNAGYGRWLVNLKPTKDSTTEQSKDISAFQRIESCTKIGTVSLKLRNYENSPLAPDVGYGLLPAFQGKGYAPEAAAALIHWFEEEKGQKEFFGFCDPSNEGSKAVLRRMGFEERGVRSIKGMYSNDGIIVGAVFSKGIPKELEAYGLI